ncbi:dephospho-CoA kinase [Rhodopseudomonas julia]|uniref:Dephospho-CoA kinase n=1 Tax=Rhodopseudomonas julia TaxID=200617 RepID=A0ABU0C206_9BRAD|nr:AAA family ATPase [Rhodopseudomonas julia]MDQ0324541.1 dephospho-CoA kinase [Rhodopseudomonas julia]
MPHILLINGPAGVGKTTVTGLLAQARPGTIAISGDALRSFAPDDVATFLGPGSTYRAGAALATAYLAMGASQVLFDYIFQTAENVQKFKKHVPQGTRVHLFTIWAPIETVLEREATREGRNRLGARVVETYRAIERNLSHLGKVVENTGTPEMAVTTILRHVAALDDDNQDRAQPGF